MADNVNHPTHYTDGKYETIEFIERNSFDYHDGNAIKYISRAGKKDPNKLIEDLEKALWYINRADHKLDYDNHAITVHDYILDKKLSPALASVIALIETSCYQEAYEMLKAEIKRLKKESNFHIPDYEGSIVCTKSSDPAFFTVGKVYTIKEGLLNDNQGPGLEWNVFGAKTLNDVISFITLCECPSIDFVDFVEFKGEA